MAANGVSGPHGTDRPAGEPGPQAVSLGGVRFGDVLKALNPLQYLPVIGTIYRVATGDAAPVSMRTGISAVAGLLTGGPIGLLGSIAGSLFEQFFHIEDRLRVAVTGAPNDQPAPVLAYAAPAVTAAAGQVAAAVPVGRAVAAYREAGLLGAV